jgi:hypothetical protein
MKTLLTLCGTALLLFTAALSAQAEIIAGPITNPATGRDYYLLAPNSWSLSQAEAESLGGTLAVIKNEDEQKWVFATFGAYGGVNRELWIGLHKTSENKFAWVTGEPLDYTNWGPNQPDNAGNVESAVQMWKPDSNVAGFWNDSPEDSAFSGVVELPGKAETIALSKAARALTGTWYEGGNKERPCWITATDNLLFVISNNRVAQRVGLCTDGSLLFVFKFQGESMPPTRLFTDQMRTHLGLNAPLGQRAEIIKDRILWNSGTWWSRKPTSETKNETAKAD